MQCITEAERYSAKGFVAKPDKNKGAQKQEIWTECIQELSERPNFDRNTKNVLQRIATQSNVPRKKPKFVNFLKSSMRFNPSQAERIWTIIEEGLEEFKKKSAPPPQRQSATAPESLQNEEDSANGVAESDSDKNDSDDVENNTNGISSDVSIESVIEHALNQSELGKNIKKILKKLQKRTDIPLNVQLPKKKKFLKFLQEKLELDAGNCNAVWESVLSSIQALSTTVNNESNGIAGKKRKNSNDIDVVSKKSKIDNTEVSLPDSTTDANGESTFDWQKHILRIFKKNQTNNQLSVDSLKSKVIKKFLKSIGEDDSNNTQYEKKFKKNLKKINELTSASGFVQLKA